MSPNHKSIENLDFILVQHELGASLPGSSQGPQSVFQSLIGLSPKLSTSKQLHVQQPKLDEKIETTPHAKNLAFSIQTMKQVRDHVKQSLTDHRVPIVLSGDHSTAAGTMAGIKLAFPSCRLGVIWFDAHTDIHSPYTSHSANLHGMPLGISTGQDKTSNLRQDISESERKLWKQAKELSGPKLAAKLEDIVFLGVRDIEPEEDTLVHANGSLILDVRTINSNDPSELADRIQKHLKSCDVIYLSMDIDCLDADLVPGTGARSPHGPNIEKIIQLISILSAWDRVVCFEMSEVNPALDQDNQTSKLAAKIVLQML